MSIPFPKLYFFEIWTRDSTIILRLTTYQEDTNTKTNRNLFTSQMNKIILSSCISIVAVCILLSLHKKISKCEPLFWQTIVNIKSNVSFRCFYSNKNSQSTQWPDPPIAPSSKLFWRSSSSQQCSRSHAARNVPESWFVIDILNPHTTLSVFPPSDTWMVC